MDNLTVILGGVITVLIPAIFKFYTDVKTLKKQSTFKEQENQTLKKELRHHEVRIDYLNRLLHMRTISKISDAVNSLFENTIVDRFLILIAVNGQDDFNVVSVIYEQWKGKNRINALGTYRNVRIDKWYKSMLDYVENVGAMTIEVENMSTGILKNFYQSEGIKYSKIRFLDRRQIDDQNDLIVYTSIATYNDEPFDKNDLLMIDNFVDLHLLPNLNNLMNE